MVVGPTVDADGGAAPPTLVGVGGVNDGAVVDHKAFAQPIWSNNT